MAPVHPPTVDARAMLRTVGLRAWYGTHEVLHGIHLAIPPQSVTALLGPMGAGKSTLLRCLNRMHERDPGARVEGEIFFDERSVYDRAVDPCDLRRQVSLVASPPALFAFLSLQDNVLASERFGGHPVASGWSREAWTEACLRRARLWDETRERLHAPPATLNRGQQQRLCVARALALRPKALLLDEPFANLDSEETARMEEMIDGLRSDTTVVVIPSTLQEAGRVANHAVLLLGGRLIESGPTTSLLRSPQHRETEDYLTGKFGLKTAPPWLF